MKLPDVAWRRRPGLEGLLEALGAREGETRFVGGCVRDALLGLDVADVDLATRLTPQTVMARLEQAGIKAVPTGLAHGTVTAVVAGAPVEVTTLRRDVATDGRRATVAFTDDWREDAERRDFTINALSADPAGGEIHDYFGGLADLEAGHVRFIGDPLQRIAEDHLRILRFFRFHARFGKGEPDPASLEACAKRANDLMALSRERIASELTRLLALPDPAPTLTLMIDRGIQRPVLPEIESAGRLAALVEAERETGVAPHPIRRLAALLPPDPEIAGSVAARLRLSKRDSARLVSAAERELDEPRLLAYRIGNEEAVDRLLLAGRLDEDPASLQSWERPRLPITGGRLIELGLEPGPVVAATLQAVEQDWAEAGFPDDPESVYAIVQARIAQALRERQ